MMISDLKADFKRYESYRPEKEKDYICTQNGLHKYITKREDETLLAEICECCGHETRWNRVEGRIDSIRYGETHILYFMQKGHPFYDYYYPNYKMTHAKVPDKIVSRKDQIEANKELFMRSYYETK